MCVYQHPVEVTKCCAPLCSFAKINAEKRQPGGVRRTLSEKSAVTWAHTLITEMKLFFMKLYEVISIKNISV